MSHSIGAGTGPVNLQILFELSGERSVCPLSLLPRCGFFCMQVQAVGWRKPRQSEEHWEAGRGAVGKQGERQDHATLPLLFGELKSSFSMDARRMGLRESDIVPH